MPCRMESGRSNERRKWRGMESNHRPQGYDPCELPTAPPRDFQGLQRHDCFTSFCIHPYAYVLCVAQALGSAGLNLFAKQIFIGTPEKISRKKKDSNLRYALTYATLAMWCFRPLSHSSVLPPSSRLSPVYALVRRYYLRMNKRSFVIPSYI